LKGDSADEEKAVKSMENVRREKALVHSGRQTRSMSVFWFILGMVLACYVGFSRLNHLRFLNREPIAPVLENQKQEGIQRHKQLAQHFSSTALSSWRVLKLCMIQVAVFGLKPPIAT
jgi:hypothetical protein